MPPSPIDILLREAERAANKDEFFRLLTLIEIQKNPGMSEDDIKALVHSHGDLFVPNHPTNPNLGIFGEEALHEFRNLRNLPAKVTIGKWQTSWSVDKFLENSLTSGGVKHPLLASVQLQINSNQDAAYADLILKLGNEDQEARDEAFENIEQDFAHLVMQCYDSVVHWMLFTPDRLNRLLVQLLVYVRELGAGEFSKQFDADHPVNELVDKKYYAELTEKIRKLFLAYRAPFNTDLAYSAEETLNESSTPTLDTIIELMDHDTFAERKQTAYVCSTRLFDIFGKDGFATVLWEHIAQVVGIVRERGEDVDAAFEKFIQFPGNNELGFTDITFFCRNTDNVADRVKNSVSVVLNKDNFAEIADGVPCFFTVFNSKDTPYKKALTHMLALLGNFSHAELFQNRLVQLMETTQRNVVEDFSLRARSITELFKVIDSPDNSTLTQLLSRVDWPCEGVHQRNWDYIEDLLLDTQKLRGIGIQLFEESRTAIPAPMQRRRHNDPTRREVEEYFGDSDDDQYHQEYRTRVAREIREKNQDDSVMPLVLFAGGIIVVAYILNR